MASLEANVDLMHLRLAVEREIERDGHGEIAKLCRTALSSQPKDEWLWLRLLCVSMLHSSDIHGLVSLVEGHDELAFYRIYGLYLQRESEAAKRAIDALSDPQKQRLSEFERSGLLWLRYQVLDRMGAYGSALDALDEIERASKDENEAELAINRMSTLMAKHEYDDLRDLEDKEEMKTGLDSNSDFVFNRAMTLILCDRIDDAKALLLSSLSLVWHQNEK